MLSAMGQAQSAAAFDSSPNGIGRSLVQHPLRPWPCTSRVGERDMCQSMLSAMEQAQSAPVVSPFYPRCCGQRFTVAVGFDDHANVARSQFTNCRPMAERHLSLAPFTLLPPIVAITPCEGLKAPRWHRPHAYFSTSAQQRALVLASLHSTHTSNQGYDVLVRLGPSWAGYFATCG